MRTVLWLHAVRGLCCEEDCRVGLSGVSMYVAILAVSHPKMSIPLKRFCNASCDLMPSAS